LGSNLGDREAALAAAINTMDAMPGTKLRSCSRWHPTQPVGIPGSRHEFLNGVAMFETGCDAEEFFRVLHSVQSKLGRRESRNPADRPIDLDLLLYDQQIIDTPTLTVPHPRMSFRRFVLVPATDIADQWVHPTIGWTLGQLLHHLDTGADSIAIVSPDESARSDLAMVLADECAAPTIAPPLDSPHWPHERTTWLAVPTDAAESRSGLPKLSILLDPPAGSDAAWAALAGQAGRGPTLRIPAARPDRVAEEALAAVEAVWPHLGPAGD
jgi:2-amino-4-hydroxy-6-hydroxymethyldihydropteridine diphosphokinase